MQLVTCEPCKKQTWLPFDFVSRSIRVLGLRNGLIKDDIDEEANGLFKYISRILEPKASIKN